MSFLCQFCGKSLSSKQSYSRHWINIHNGNCSFSCFLCQKQYRRKDNLQNHIVRVHVTGGKDLYRKKCEFCNKTVSKQKYKRHLMLMHRPVIDKVDDRPKVNCPICGVQFNFKSSLSNHKRKVHKILPKNTSTIKCPLCNFMTATGTTKSIYSHFKNKHEISMKFEMYNFKSIEEFYTWKRKIEKDTISSFRSNRKESTFLKFKCHRSGKYISTTNKRNLKINGSCKINGFCPAFINVNINRSNIRVKFQKTHVGHKNELQHLTLTPDERKAIAIELAKNIPSHEILKRIRSSLTNSSLQRIHLTNKKDLDNIKKSFGLSAVASEQSVDCKLGVVDNEVHNGGVENLFKSTIIEEQFVDNMAKVLDSDVRSNSEEVENLCEVNAIAEQSVHCNSKGIEHLREFNEKEDNSVAIETQEENNSFHQKAQEEKHFLQHELATVVEQSVSLNTEPPEQPVTFTKEEIKRLLCKFTSKKAVKNSFGFELDKWVQNLKSSQNPFLIVYKSLGCVDSAFPGLEENDFLLIFMTETQKDILIKDSQDIVCLDEMHCHNVRLYALLTPDETREAFPVAFIFTNRGDQLVMSIFFEKIKESVGVLTPKVFISNMEESFYSSWKNIMGETRHLYSTWYVLKVWRTNVKNKVKYKQKIIGVYKTLQTLLYELDVGNFHTLLENYLTNWSEDADTSEFQEYFHRLFIAENQFKKWAYCFRVNSGFNINISMESFNRILNYCHIRGEKIKRDEKLFDMLNIVRDKLFELIVKINKSNVEMKLVYLRYRHGHSYASDTEYVIQEEDKWQVLNYVNEIYNEVYIVKKVKECNFCSLQCDRCNSCFHEYVCSCSDHLVKNNMCKHAHLVARTQKLIEQNSSEAENSMEISTPDEAVLVTKDLI